MKIPKPDIFHSRSFLLVAHYATFAYQDLLYDYLTKKGARLVTKFNIPLPELLFLRQVEITRAEAGKTTGIRHYPTLKNPPFLAYLIQSMQFFLLVILSSESYDMVIAEDSLLAFVCVALRFCGKVKRVVFFSHGIDKKRLPNRLFNQLYQSLDKISAVHADYNWFLNSNMRQVRLDQGIRDEKLFWIPAGIPVYSIPRRADIYNHRIVFLGVLSIKNGAHLIPEIANRLRKKIPDLTIDVIGEGELSESIRADIRRLKLEDTVIMKGLRTSEEFLPKITGYAVGIAPYEDDMMTLSSSSDPMKMRIYLSAGLPVVITKGFNFSSEITKYNLGYEADYDTNSFVQALSKLLRNKKMYYVKRRNALEYSKRFDVIDIYNRTFTSMFK
ncbi:glycosyltransferase [Patescibacteria group bacterium]|nr:glycosyltransferase [Patescibacteria group bacterium]